MLNNLFWLLNFKTGLKTEDIVEIIGNLIRCPDGIHVMVVLIGNSPSEYFFVRRDMLVELSKNELFLIKLER